MSIEYLQSLKSVTAEPGPWRQYAAQGRQQTDFLKLDAAARENASNLCFSYTASVAVFGVINVKVVPQNSTIVLHDTKHFPC